jgi:iron uptake system component EfeO
LRRAAFTAALAAALATTAGVTVACSGGTAPANLVSVSNGGCGSSWHLAAPGWHTFQVHNAAAENAEVDLVNPANGAVYAEVEALGPGTTNPMRLNVGSGSYAFPRRWASGHRRPTPACSARTWCRTA